MSSPRQFYFESGTFRPFALLTLAIAVCVYAAPIARSPSEDSATEDSAKDVRSISLVDAYYFHKEERALFVDLRPQADFTREKIAAAIHYTDKTLAERAQSAPNIVIYGGTLEDIAAKAVLLSQRAKAGSGVYLLDQGISEWAALDLPTARQSP